MPQPTEAIVGKLRQILADVGMGAGEVLGRGTSGFVERVCPDVVVKFTSELTEARMGTRLLRQSRQGWPRVFGVVGVEAEGYRGFAIVREEVSPLHPSNSTRVNQALYAPGQEAVLRLVEEIDQPLLEEIGQLLHANCEFTFRDIAVSNFGRGRDGSVVVMDFGFIEPRVPDCVPLVDEWDGVSSLVIGLSRQCESHEQPDVD